MIALKPCSVQFINPFKYSVSEQSAVFAFYDGAQNARVGRTKTTPLSGWPLFVNLSFANRITSDFMQVTKMYKDLASIIGREAAYVPALTPL